MRRRDEGAWMRAHAMRPYVPGFMRCAPTCRGYVCAFPSWGVCDTPVRVDHPLLGALIAEWAYAICPAAWIVDD